MMNSLWGWGGRVATDEQFEGMYLQMMNSLRGGGEHVPTDDKQLQGDGDGHVPTDDELFEGMGRACIHS